MDNAEDRDRSSFAPLTEADRVAQAAGSSGQPVDSSREGTSPYISYQSIDVLHSLQHPRSAEPAELTFYTIGQVMELLFSLLHHEVVRARDALVEGDVKGALWVLRRIVHVQFVLEACWKAIESISVAEFNNFRDELGAASGVQSYKFRQLEFALGNKNRHLAELHQHVPGAAEDVDRALRERSLWDAATLLLSQRGHAINPSCLDRDWGDAYESDDSVEHAWLKVLQTPAADYELSELAEALSLVAYNHHRWRSVHLLIAERMLGSKPGTGGTSGVAWLRRAAEHRIFPELLTARSFL